jgi:hypothetical protein
MTKVSSLLVVFAILAGVCLGNDIYKMSVSQVLDGEFGNSLTFGEMIFDKSG